MRSDPHSRLSELRRDLHRRPELGWCEFYTTGRIVDALHEVDLDELYVGSDVHGDDKVRHPSAAALDRASTRARDLGVDEAVRTKREAG